MIYIYVDVNVFVGELPGMSVDSTRSGLVLQDFPQSSEGVTISQTCLPDRRGTHAHLLLLRQVCHYFNIHDMHIVIISTISFHDILVNILKDSHVCW